MGKIYEKAHGAWYDYRFGDLHEREKAAKTSDNEEGVQQCWAEFSKLLKQDAQRKKNFFPKGDMWDFSEVSKLPVFAENDEYILSPVGEKYLDDFSRVRRLWVSKERYSENLERAMLEVYKEETKNPQSLICAAIDRKTNTFCGYVSIKDSSMQIWEIAIELLPDYCGCGIGPEIIPLFLITVGGLTGRTEFRAIVEPDNYASQKCMKKAGAKLVGLIDCVFGDRRAAEKFEDDNADLISGEMTELARELGVEPKHLLSTLLDYRFSL